MDCASCAVAIRNALTPLDGVKDVQVDVIGGTVRVDRDPALGARDLTRAIRAVG